MKLKKRDAFNEINITPLTDIFLVLLIIMMVIAPMLSQQGLNLTVPSNAEVKTNKQSKIMRIKVSEKGTYSMNREPIQPEQLSEFIKSKMKKYKDGLLIQAEDDATHGAVVKVMDAARNAGVTSVSLSEI